MNETWVELTIDRNFWNGVSTFEQARIIQRLDTLNLHYYPFPDVDRCILTIIIPKEYTTQFINALRIFKFIRVTSRIENSVETETVLMPTKENKRELC